MKKVLFVFLILILASCGPEREDFSTRGLIQKGKDGELRLLKGDQVEIKSEIQKEIERIESLKKQGKSPDDQAENNLNDEEKIQSSFNPNNSGHDPDKSKDDVNNSPLYKMDLSKKPNIAEKDGVIEIGDDFYLTHLMHLFNNFEEYKDKKIKIEGMYSKFQSLDKTLTIQAVYRKAPGCCGDDGWGGLYIEYDGVSPQPDEWVEVIGSVRFSKDNNQYGVILVADSLKILAKRGKEFVDR